MLKQSEIARDAGLSQATAARYINLLEIGGLLIKLRPYTKSISKRIIKLPKVYFIDPGLVCTLCGFKSKMEVPVAFWGALFESFVLLNLSAMASLYGGGTLLPSYPRREGKESGFYDKSQPKTYYNRGKTQDPNRF